MTVGNLERRKHTLKSSMNLTKVLLMVTLIALLLCCQSCQTRVKEKFEVRFSDAVHVVRDGKIIAKDGREVQLSEIEGFFVITPGLVRKLYRERLDDD